jgi:hypothetical protein
MDDPQDVDVVRDALHISGEWADLEKLPDGLDQRPALRVLVGDLTGAADRQRADETNDLLGRIGEPVDQLRQVVFEEVFPVDRKISDQVDIVRAVGTDEAEIAQVAGLVVGDAAEAESDGLILSRCKGGGIQKLEADPDRLA